VTNLYAQVPLYGDADVLSKRFNKKNSGKTGLPGEPVVNFQTRSKGCLLGRRLMVRGVGGEAIKTCKYGV